MNKELLYDFLCTPSVSGHEEALQKKVIGYGKTFADEIRTDEIADVVTVVNPEARVKVMLAAHADEIGLMVTHITEDGMLHVDKAGGIYPGSYLGQKVRVYHEGKVYYGAVRNHGSLSGKKVELTDLIVDIGAVSREDAQKYVRVGDPITFDTDYRELLNDRLTGRGLDDRLADFIILEAAKKAKEQGCSCGVYAATTVGEEISQHGAKWCAERIRPTMAVVVDVTYTTDYQGTKAEELGEIRLDHGPVLLHNPFSHKKLVSMLEEAARRQSISIQWENSCGRTCTDADAIHMAGQGIPTTVMSIPLRYMHNPAEVCSLKDVQACIELLAAFLCSVDEKISLAPLSVD